jgi:hypothetical protein
MVGATLSRFWRTANRNVRLSTVNSRLTVAGATRFPTPYRVRVKLPSRSAL